MKNGPVGLRVSLSRLLEELDDTRHLWTTVDARYSVRELCHAVSGMRRFMGYCHNRRVSLEVTDTVEALICMLALDGIAESVFLVPASLQGADSCQLLMSQFDPHEAITDTSLSPRLVEESRSVLWAGPESGAMDTGWVLATSGTTGVPKLIRHSTLSLTRTCRTDRISGERYTWALVFDPFRFAGLQVVLQSLISGSSLVLCHDCGGIQEQVELMREHSVNALSATPSYWRKLLFSGALKTWQPDQITLGGEPADQGVLDALRSACPKARIRHIYASTETGVGFSVADGQAGFPLEVLEEGVGGNYFDIGPEGTLRVRRGQHGAAVRECELTTGSCDFIDTGDLVETRGNRVFFLGRSSGAINVGGNKVIPEEVEAVVREVEGVAEALVRPQPSSVLGQLVVAIIEPGPGAQEFGELKVRIRTHCLARLDKYKVPAMIRIVDDIARNSAGKIGRT